MAGIGLTGIFFVLVMLNTPGAEPVAAQDGPLPKLEAKRSAQKNSFYQVAKYLDVGGELFVYLSAEQAMAEAEAALKNVDGLFQALVPMMDEREAKEARFVLKAIGAGLKETGLREISGLGASSIALRPGFYRGVTMLHRYPGNKNPGLIWTWAGPKAHPQDGLKLMPASTVLAAHGDIDAAGTLAWVRKFVKQNAPPEAVEEFEEALEEANEEIQLGNLIQAFGGDLGFSITLDEKRMVQLPLSGEEPIEFPEPGFVFAIKAKGDVYADMIGGTLGGLEKEEVKVGNVTLHVHSLPEQLPLDVRPTLFTSQGYLVLASNPRLAREILAIQAGRSKGLVGTKEFQALSEGMKLEGNCVHFISQRFAETYFKLMDKMMEAVDEAGALPPAIRKPVDKMMADAHKQMGGYLGILRVQDDGLLYNWQALRGGQRVALMGAGAGIIAGALAFAVPATQQARDKARQAVSMNNVKQLTIGMFVFADDNQGHLPEAFDWSDDLLPLVGNEAAVFASPEHPVVVDGDRPPCTYAFNAAMGGQKIGALKELNKTVLFLDLPNGWNGTFRWPLPPIDHKPEYIVGFADGHIEIVPFNKLGQLRWKP